MSLADVVARMSQIQALAGQALAPADAPQQDTGSGDFSAAMASLVDPSSSGDDPSSFGSGLPQILPMQTTTPTAAPLSGTSGGPRVLAEAETQVGVSEQPPGSNDGPQIAGYRSAVAGAGAGEPWCAYFASWAAAGAGVPLGDAGQGLGSVAEITDWAGRSGRLLPATETPTPGDLILYGDRHVGIVESVNPDGSLTTIEGNYGNAVSRVHRSPAEATGYVRL